MRHIGIDALASELRDLTPVPDIIASRKFADLPDDPEYDRITITCSDAQLYIALRGFTIFDDPRGSQSGTSAAQYLAVCKNGPVTLLLQYLPADGVTSTHYHEHTEETFFALAGKATVGTIWNKPGTEEQLCEKPILHRPFIIHYVSANLGSDSLALIQMRSGGAQKRTEAGVKLKDHFYITDDMPRIDVGAKNPFPADVLSNLTDHPFIINGVHCAGMEGFLQALKEPDPDKQKEICALSGFPAKRLGTKYNEARAAAGKRLTEVYWQGAVIPRVSNEFDILINRAYVLMLANAPAYADALRATDNAVLVHTIGNSDPYETILTERELCSTLLRLRTALRTGV